MDPVLVKQLNQKVREELLKKEIEVMQYALAELEKIVHRRHQDLAGLQSDLQTLLQKFQNRLKVLKNPRMTGSCSS